MQRLRSRHIARRLSKWLLAIIAALLLVVVAALIALETGWSKERLRRLIVSQANPYLTATLEIGALEGSLFRGVELRDVRLTRDGETVVAIEHVALSYSVRELFDQGITIQRIRVVRPRVVVRRQADGRWNLAALVRRDAREQERRGPRRPIHLRLIEVVDGDVAVLDPLNLAFARAPGRYAALNASLSYDYEPVEWRMAFTNASWNGGGTDLTMNRLAGTIASGDAGLSFDNLAVETPRSAFVVNGRVIRDQRPTSLDLHVKADRFAFQEWAGQVGGLRNIAVESSFDVRLRGPLNRLATDLTLQSNGGSVVGAFVLDTTVPGSHGAGAVEIGKLDLARWLNRPNRASDITGRVAFDLDLELGQAGGFPRGPYTFEGSHARFMEYEATDVRARGRLTEDEAVIAEAIAIAYGADVRIASGAIGIASPYRYRFQGIAERVDLRRMPQALPLPHVESVLALEYDVTGRFAAPVIAGRATFADSEFLGARILAGATGSIDTSARPVRYAGEGPIVGIDLHRFARELDVGWLRDPRYAGTVSGRFNVDGSGTTAATMTLKGGGRLTRAELFDGTLSDADVSIEIGSGSMRASYEGRFNRVDPAIALNDEQFKASLSGSGAATIAVKDLFVREVDITDYTIDATLLLEESIVRGIPIDAGNATTSLAGGVLTMQTLDVRGPAVTGRGTGSIGLAGARPIDFTYDIAQADLTQFKEMLGRDISGQFATKGRASGTPESLRVAGKGTVSRLSMAGVGALATSGDYDATIPTADPARTTATVAGEATFVELFDQSLRQASGTVTYDAGRIDVNLVLSQSETVNGRIAGTMAWRADRRAIDVSALTITLQEAAWRLVPAAAPATVRWGDGEIAVSPMTFVDAVSGAQRIDLSGTWREDGRGALEIAGRGVSLDTLTSMSGRPAIYGGLLDVDATVSGTSARPTVAAQLTVTEGRIRRLAYEKLAGRVDYTDNFLKLDLRLDQAPGIWLTAVGTVPMGLFDRTRPDGPLDVAIASSSVGLGLVEAVTDAVTDVTGTLQLNVTAVGTSRDPHFTGDVNIQKAEFTVGATGVRYRNGTVALQLSEDRVAVEQFRLEDPRGRTLELRGSLGTHELRVSDLAIDARAQQFAVLRNEFGEIDVDANLSVTGQFERPRVFGNITVVNGDLNVDSILDQTLFRPYATEAATTTAPVEVDALAALNPWDRLGLDIELHVPNTLRMTGDNVQVAPGTPLGLSSFNLRVLGDLYLYKDPGQPLYVLGSFDSVTGNYSFQGRRFDLDPASSINFRGDLTPEVYVTVSRLISGVETRVTIAGTLREPELRLASTPPLESSDILSLIVFGTSTNELTAAQQQELAVRAGTLAAGFLATPLIGALERTLGLEILEIEAPNQPGAGARVTVGDELAPGLVARFSRQFGRDEYDEATIEYHLSRMFRIRATFSDAGVLLTRSPFRRVERAGIDFLVFFSF